MLQEIDAYPTGGPLTTQEIISQLNNPYSRLRQDVGVYITSVYIKSQIEIQDRYLAIILAERELISSHRSSISSDDDDIDEQILEKLQPVPAKNEALLQMLQIHSQELDKLYKAYDKININIIKSEKSQREEYNHTLKALDINPKFQLTPEKQVELHKLFEQTEKRFERETYERITRKEGLEAPTDNQLLERKNLAKEIHLMALQTKNPASETLLASDVKELSKGELFEIVNKHETDIMAENKKLEALMPQIMEKQGIVAEIAQQLNQNTARLAPVLTPHFSSAKNDDELAGKLKDMYEALEKTRTTSGASYNPSAAFEFRLNSQLQKMPSEERNEFFKKAEGFVPKDEKHLNIASALENMREKYRPASPTPFDTMLTRK